MKKFERFDGLIAAPFTPMNGDGSINLTAIAKYADYVANQGVVGVFICGTTGEGVSMTVAERKSVAEEWVKVAGERLKVIVHVGCNCQKDSMALAAHAQECGAYAIASIAPNFYKPDCVEDLIEFFAPVAASAPKLPFYYYNMPSMSGVILPVEKFLALGKERIPNLAGVKFTHNNLMEMNACLHYNDGEFEVLHGYDEILLSGLAIGAKAGVGSTYNYAGKIYNNILKAFNDGDLQKAREYQMYSVEIVKILIKYGGGVLCGKAIMNLVGVPCGECRSPLHKFTQSEYDSLKKDLDSIAFFEKCK